MGTQKSFVQKEGGRLKKIAHWYDPTMQRAEYNLIRCRLKTILSHIKGPKVLEMGCSTGIMTKPLSEKFRLLAVVDGSQKYIEFVKKLVGKKPVRFFVSLFETFEPQEQFDDILMANILEHVADPILIMKRVRKWLKPGGRVHILVPNALSFHRRLGHKMGILRRPDSFTANDRKIGHRRVYTKATLLRDVTKAGLHLAHYEGIMLKPFSHSQMNSFSDEVFEGLCALGKELPEYCSTIYFICRK